MKPLFFFLCLIALVACTTQPTPTPLPMQTLPATWTPAPTPTNTPPGPTATLVIQNTRAPLATRDPNARILPTIPPGSAGIWLDLTLSPENAAAVEDVEIILSQNPNQPRRNNQFLFLETGNVTALSTLTPGINGIVLGRSALDGDAPVAALRESIKPRLLLARAFISETTALEQVAPNVDGVLLDNFLRAATAPMNSFPDEFAWKNQIDTLARYSARPAFVVLAAPGFPASIREAQASDADQWGSFAFASFLLGVNNTNTFYGVAPYSYLQTPTLPKSLGLALGGYTKLNGIYQRRFANGLVLVNPTDEIRAFFLPRAYVDSNGAPVPQIELPPHTGQILYSAAQ